MTESPLRLGELLVETGVLTQDALENALTIQKERQLRLGTILLQEGFVSEAQLVQALSRRLSIPWVSLWHVDIPDDLLSLVPANIAEEFFLIPVYVRIEAAGERALYVAMNDPTDDSALRFVAASAGMAVKPMVAAPSDIASAIRFYYYGEDVEEEEVEATPRAGSLPPTPPTSTPRVTAPPAPPTSPVKAPEPPPEEVEIAEIEEIVEEEVVVPAETEESTEPPSGDAPVEEAPSDDDSEDSKRAKQRAVEKHMFGVGKKKARAALALTLLDGTTIPFGQAATKKKRSDEFTQDDLIDGLRALAKGTPVDDFLPSERWEDYMAALLQVLMKKHLVFFKEYMDELKKE